MSDLAKVVYSDPKFLPLAKASDTTKRLLNLLDGPTANVEDYLQHLSESSVYLSEEDIHRRQRLAEVVQDRIVEEIENKSRDAVIPKSLVQLIRNLSDSNVPVLTTNYDTLIERAYCDLGQIGSNGASTPIDLIPIVADYAFDRVGLRAVGQNRNISSLSIIKLHGSIDWYSPGELSEELCIHGSDQTLPIEFRKHVLRSEIDIEGMRRIIALPSPNKKNIINQAVMRKVWREARRSLHSTSRLIIVGSEIHKLDQSLRALLRESLPAGSSVHVLNQKKSSCDAVRELLPEISITFTEVSKIEEVKEVIDSYLGSPNSAP